MILSDKDIRQLLILKQLIIDPINEDQIGPTSIDLHLGISLVKYCEGKIKLGLTNPDVIEIEINALDGYCLNPNEFVLGCTKEKIYIPNGYQGFIETKGNIARAGIQTHNADGHVDPGSDHVVTLEIKNNNTIPIVLFPDILICQLYIHKLTSKCEKIYNGKYWGQTKPTKYIPDLINK